MDIDFKKSKNEKEERFHAKEDYIEVSQKIKHALIQSEKELLAKKVEAISEEPSKLDVLWDLCEYSTDRTKLILADSLSVPFYLPPKKLAFGRTPEQLEREQKRIEFIIKRDLKEHVPNKAKNIETLLPAVDNLSPRERIVGERILHEYREDTEKYRNLLNRIRGRVEEKKKNRTPLKLYEHDPQRTREIEKEKASQVLARRQALLEEQEKQREKLEQDLSKRMKSKQLKVEVTASNPLISKQKLWLQVIEVIQIISKTHHKVDNYRQLKEKHANMWNKALVIQRAYRKWKGLKSGNDIARNTKSRADHIMKKFRTSSMFIGINTTQILHSRQEAANIIINFLFTIQKNWKNFALGYLRKIKRIQRAYRRHLALNHARYVLILLYVEKLYPIINTHFQLILSGKGYDLQNMLSQDINILHDRMKTYSTQFHLLKEMDSNHFHSYLRSCQSKHSDIINAIGRYFSCFTLRNNKQQQQSQDGKASKRKSTIAEHTGPHISTYTTAPDYLLHNHHGAETTNNKQQTQQQKHSRRQSSATTTTANSQMFDNSNTFFLSHHPYLYSYHKNYNLIDIIIKNCILELIYKKRHAYINKMDDKNPLKTSIRLDVNDIKSFIHGDGTDPLQAKLEEMMKNSDLHYYQHLHYQTMKSTLFKTNTNKNQAGTSVAGTSLDSISEGGNIIAGDGKGNVLQTALHDALEIVNKTNSTLPVVANTEGQHHPPTHHHRPHLESMVFQNPHVFKYYQLLMLFLNEITVEDLIHLLIQITEILQLIPLPYLVTNNYNQSYIQLLKSKQRKMNNVYAPTGSTSSGLPLATGTNNILDSEDNPNPVVTTPMDRSKRMTIQKGNQHLLFHQNEFYQEIFAFFHQKQSSHSHHHSSISSSAGSGGHRFSTLSEKDERESNTSGESGSQRNSFRDPRSRATTGSAGSNPAGTLGNGANPALLMLMTAPKHRNSNEAMKARHSMIRNSLLVNRADLRRMSLIVSMQGQGTTGGIPGLLAAAGGAGAGGGGGRRSVITGRKTSIIPENQRKYGKPIVGRGNESESDDDDDEDDDDEDDDNREEEGGHDLSHRFQNDSSSLKTKHSPALPFSPSRPSMVRKSSIAPTQSHRRMSRL